MEKASFVLIITVLALCSASDIFRMRVNNVYLLPLSFAGLPVLLSHESSGSLLNLLSAFIIILFGCTVCGKKKYIGGADVKILAVLCSFCGPAVCFSVFITACFTAGLFFVTILLPVSAVSKLIKKAQTVTLKKELPFVPFITLGYIFIIMSNS